MLTHQTETKTNKEGKALASATSLLAMEDCVVGEMSPSAVSMPAAGVRLRRNRIGTLNSGALDLREWNDVLIENNTFGLVERQAFYNIAEPRWLSIQILKPSLALSAFFLLIYPFSSIHSSGLVSVSGKIYFSGRYSLGLSKNPVVDPVFLAIVGDTLKIPQQAQISHTHT